MLGYIEYDGRRGKMRAARETRLGGAFFVVYTGCAASGFGSRRRAVRAANVMRRSGVHRAVFPVDFPYTAIFREQGILPVDPMPLRVALCTEYVRGRLAAAGIEESTAVVAVCGDILSAALERTVRELIRVFRNVLVSVPQGGERLAGELRRQMGAVVQVNPSRHRLEQADALVLFAPRGDLAQNNKVLCALYPGAPERGKIKLHPGKGSEGEIAENCSGEQLAAALYSMGVLTARRLLSEISC